MCDETPQKTPQPAVSEYEMREKALSFAMTHRIGGVFGKTIDEELATAMTLKSAEEFLRFLQGGALTQPSPETVEPARLNPNERAQILEAAIGAARDTAAANGRSFDTVSLFAERAAEAVVLAATSAITILDSRSTAS